MVLRDGKAGMLSLRQATVTRWFSPKFAASQQGEVGRLLDSLVNTSPQDYAANCAALHDADFTHQLAAVQLPVMVICADQDPVNNVADGELLEQAITVAQLVTLCAAHLSNVEARQFFSSALLAFLMSRA
ncbi:MULTISPECIES: hypothetical protein [unclassified Pseudomonas]|uniref:hypothetical protein n=1 Tax=unclassified Pseudomonas TaxID=196821 RepID=UPI000B8344A9|nr:MULTISPECIES: hypothetical protein [unclassified Pseudomonas]